MRELLQDGLLKDSEIAAIWKAVKKADTATDKVDFRGFSEAFARVDALFEEEEEAAEAAEEGDEGAQKIEVGGGSAGVGVDAGGEQGGGAAATSFGELVGSSEGLLDLAGLLR